eukprot:GHVS01081656.1.p1 GENE.GHVS01081656.1~~GHVS01081656.1.p1  ORF type:complete len:269 (+),score=33.91 GHVS01081656.1:155-961(+)
MAKVTSSSSSSLIVLLMFLLSLLFGLLSVDGAKETGQKTLANDIQSLFFYFRDSQHMKDCRIFQEGLGNIGYVNDLLTSDNTPACKLDDKFKADGNKMGILKKIPFIQLQATARMFTDQENSPDTYYTQLVRFSPVAGDGSQHLNKDLKKFFENFDRNLDLMAEAFGATLKDSTDWPDNPSVNGNLKKLQLEDLRAALTISRPRPRTGKQLKGGGNDPQGASSSSSFSLLRISSYASTSYILCDFVCLFFSTPCLIVIGSLVLSFLSV